MTTLDTPAAIATTTTARKALAARSKRALVFGYTSMALPVVGIAVGGWLALRGSKALGALVGGASLGFALVRWQLARAFTETVAYEVEETVGDLEIRRYAAHVRAETVIEQRNWTDALNDGFERLAGYIFRGNDTRSRIEMTAPVFATIGDDAVRPMDRVVAFVMPGDRELGDLPKPTDARVQLRHVAGERVAVLTFDGDYRSPLPIEKGGELVAKVRAAGLSARGEVRFGGYDAPGTLPGLRRNEVAVAIDE